MSAVNNHFSWDYKKNKLNSNWAQPLKFGMMHRLIIYHLLTKFQNNRCWLAVPTKIKYTKSITDIKLAIFFFLFEWIIILTKLKFNEQRKMGKWNVTRKSEHRSKVVWPQHWIHFRNSWFDNDSLGTSISNWKID